MAASELLLAIRHFPIVKWLEDKGFEHFQEHEWEGTCPDCGKEGKLIVNSKRKAYHCYVCEEYAPKLINGQLKKRAVRGAGGLLKLIALYERCNLRQAAERVLGAARYDPQALEEIPALDFLIELVEEPEDVRPVAAPPGWYRITGTLPYMHQRGITMADVEMFGIFAVAGGVYRDRLVFPVWERGQLIYWQARAMWEGKDRGPKTLNPPKTEGCAGSSDVLMNLETAAQFPRVAITEGPIDCTHTGPSGTCSFGKRITPTQIGRLLKAGVKAIDLLWDGPSENEPEGAWKEMVEAAEMLSLFFDTNLVKLPWGDPGVYRREEIDQFRAYGIPAAQLSSLARI